VLPPHSLLVAVQKFTVDRATQIELRRRQPKGTPPRKVRLSNPHSRSLLVENFQTFKTKLADVFRGKGTSVAAGCRMDEAEKGFGPRDALATVDEAALAFVAIKAVGYLFFSHMPAASFLISLMRIGAIEPIKELLLGSLLINYPGSLRTFVETRITSEPESVAAALRDCLAQLDRYLKNIEAAMGIKELRASAEQRATFHKTLTQKLSKSFEAAQKEMPLLSLVKRSIVLYGRGSVQRVVHADGTTHRADMMFKTQGTEFSFPRMSHIDELGLHLQLRIFRVGKRNQ
jgi:hypothetical protein